MTKKNFYCYIRKMYCDDLYNWHPVFGTIERPFSMDAKEFHHRLFSDDILWWMWEEYDQHCPDLNDMIEECEFRFGKFFHISGNRFVSLRQMKAIKLTRPFIGVNKNFKICHISHLPTGKLINKRELKQQALKAQKLIEDGMGVYEALKATGVHYNQLNRMTDFEPSRAKKIDEKVEKVTELILSGMNQSQALNEVGLPRYTYWKRTGGINKILNNKKE